MATNPVAAAQNLTTTLAAALADPSIPASAVEAAARTAHDAIEATGGDYAGVFSQVQAPATTP